jgi:extracellular factor (EF) 3-hydroxypalmitic acid methyl ester biosynthesis protein
METRDVNMLPHAAEAMLICETTQGTELRASLVRLTRHQAVFEIYNTEIALRVSEVLTNFKVLIGSTPVFSGRGVIRSLINTGNILVCEAELDEGWIDFDALSLTLGSEDPSARYKQFIHRSQNAYKVLSEFKLWVADVQTFLWDLRLWSDQIELGIRSLPSGDRLERERELVAGLAPGVNDSLNTLFERFEPLAEKVDEPLRPAHQAYLKRYLHPLVLCSPFAYRVFHKPLGYAGDYEMVNMLLRDPREGSSVFAKLLNCWFIAQPPAQAHRNRLTYLIDKLVDETLRAGKDGRQARILNLGCGPAGEVQQFIEQSSIANQASFTLLDFNDETLHFAAAAIEGVKHRHNRKTAIELRKKSVMQILKTGGAGTGAGRHDLVYCAGLFDYLPDRICKELMNILYEMVAPGGLLISTNVDCSNPIRNMLDYLLEWHLIYRTGAQMRAFAPDRADSQAVTVLADTTSVNVFLEARKGK